MKDYLGGGVSSLMDFAEKCYENNYLMYGVVVLFILGLYLIFIIATR